MSHFSVAVITAGKPTTEQLNNIMAPFSEEFEVESFKTKEQVIKKERASLEDYKNTTYKEFLDNPEEYKSKYNNAPKHIKYLEEEFPKKLLMTDEEIYKEAIKYEDKNMIMDDGSVKSLYNPDSKWDWWVIGGRWSNFIKVPINSISHKEAVSINDLIENVNDETVRLNIARIKDIIRVDKEKVETLKRKWELLVESSEPLTDEERETVRFSYYTLEYYIEKYKTKEKYVELESKFTTYAVLDKEGNWHEAGPMGWFGISKSKSEDVLLYKEGYDELVFNNAEENDWLTIIDCHI